MQSERQASAPLLSSGGSYAAAAHLPKCHIVGMEAMEALALWRESSGSNDVGKGNRAYEASGAGITCMHQVCYSIVEWQKYAMVAIHQL